MKRLSKTLLVALLLGGVAQGAPPAGPAFQSLRVQHQELPVFPEELTRTGIRDGEVRVVLSVDHLGNLDDLLVLFHTHPRFAEQTIAALKKWRFEPARQNGVPVAATTILTINFETKGAIVTSLSVHEQAALMVAPLMRGRYEYRLHTLRELDQIPTPISAPAPGYPRELAAKGVQGQVTVGFFIDETGAVRIPSVDITDDSRLASLAIEALRQWRFEPPRCKKVPVLVKASQVFNFRPNEKMASGGAAR